MTICVLPAKTPDGTVVARPSPLHKITCCDRCKGESWIGPLMRGAAREGTEKVCTRCVSASLKMGALALDADEFVWQLWSFDARPADSGLIWLSGLIWIRLEPALWLGMGYPMRGQWKPREDIPGEIIHEGLGGYRR